jgi:amino acid efflux transporter
VGRRGGGARVTRSPLRGLAQIRHRHRLGDHGGERALALTALIAAAYFALMVAMGMNLTPFILVHTSSMVAIYAAGMLAALGLLPTFAPSWWMALVAALMCAGLLALSWASLLPALLLAVIAWAVTGVKRLRSRAPAA